MNNMIENLMKELTEMNINSNKQNIENKMNINWEITTYGKLPRKPYK